MVRPWWLRLTAPIVALGIVASGAGLLVDRIYAHETPAWETQARGQDLANLAVLLVLALAARAVGHRSLPGLLVWLGTMVAATYTWTIYVFAVHFGPLFPVHVALFGLSAWSLIGGFSAVDRHEVHRRLGTARGQRFASALVLVVGGLFVLMWLGQDVPAAVRDTAPAELVETGLVTNPVHVLDLGLFLPLALLAGVMLWRRRAWGYVLVPVVLVAMAAISGGIVALSVLTATRGDRSALVVAAVIGVLGVVQATTAWRFLRSSAGERTEQAGGLPAGLGPLVVDVGADGDAAAGAEQPGPGTGAEQRPDHHAQVGAAVAGDPAEGTGVDATR